MSLEAYLVAEMLQRMEQHGAMIRARSVECVSALGRHEYSTALESSAELHRALDAFVATTERLQAHVVAHDGLGELGQSVGELALRARALVVTAEVDVLCQLLHEPAVHDHARGWFAGHLHEIRDVKALVRDRLTRIHAIWLPYRHDQPALPGMTDLERTSVYHTTVRAAQRALRDLRDEPDLGRFLDHGIAAAGLQAVQLACKQIDATLALEIDIESTRPRPRRRSRVAVQNGARDEQ